MNFQNCDEAALILYRKQLVNLCMYLELIIRRGMETPAIVDLYNQTKAEYQAAEAAFFATRPPARKIENKRELVNQALLTFNRYIGSIYDPNGNGLKITCDYNHPKAGQKTLTFVSLTNPDVTDEEIVDMNPIDELYGKFDEVMEEFSKDLPNA